MSVFDRRALLREIIAAVDEDTELRTKLRAALGPPATEGPRYVSVATYAREREIGRSTVRRAIDEGRLEHVRVGRLVRIPANATITPKSQADTPKTRADRVWARLSGGSR